ncbi:MAG: LysR family transcriptional regulator [Clostridia bacterium]|nr:LysR family transcriptional regulator [Clostridia bacterium]
MSDNVSRYATFLATAECSSVSRAAKQLFVSQPAVSAEIAALENSLKVKLFFRSNRGVTLTPEGRVLYEYIKKAFAFIEAGEEKLREISGLKTGLLRIGASDMTLRFFLLDYIAAYRAEYPDVRVNITNAPTPKTIESLRGGMIDFAVVSEPISLTGNDDLFFIPVRKIQDIFVAAPTLPIAQEKKISKEMLATYPMVMLERHTSTRRYVSSCLGADFPAPAVELATSDLLLEFAERGIGVASVVEDFAAKSIADGRVVKLDVDLALPPRRFYVVYLKRLPLSAAASAMMDKLRKAEI